MRLTCVATLLLMAGLVCGAQGSTLERTWEIALPDGADAAPLAADMAGGGRPSIIIPARCSGVVWQLGADGKLMRTFRLSDERIGAAAAADLDGDGSAELIAVDAAGKLRVWRGDGAVAWEAQLDSSVRGRPVATNLAGDGRPEIVIATAQGVVWCFDGRGRVIWKHELAEGWWPGWALVPAPVVVANVDGAGGPEVLLASREGFVYCLGGDGRRRWTADLGVRCRTSPATADFDGDGLLEVMVADLRGRLHCLDAASGRKRWTRTFGTPSELGGTQGLVARIATPAGVRGLLLSQEREGRLGIVAGRNVEWVWGSPGDRQLQAATAVALVDLDGKGCDDAAFITEFGDLVVVSADGTELARVATGIAPGAQPPLVADISGDARPEIVVAGEGGEVQCYSLPSGARATPAVTASASKRVGDASASATERLTGVAAKALWWSENTATPALIVTNSGEHMRHLNYRLTLEHPDRRLASTAGRIALAPRGEAAIAVPYISVEAGRYLLRCDLTENGKSLSATAAHRVGEPVAPGAPRLAMPSASQRELAVPASWRMPMICGRDFWHVARYQPGKWQECGLGEEPFIKQAVPRVWAPPDVFKRDFAPDSPVRKALLADDKPLMLMNEYFGPRRRVDPVLYRAFERDFGERFVGFASHEWAYGAVTGWAYSGLWPRTRAEAAQRLARELHRQLDLTYGKLYAGEGYRLPHHLAFREGLPAAYAEIGENIPCTPLQVAVLRGAARQYGRPWGVYISAWYLNSVTTYESPDADTLESSGAIFSGPYAGHSVSLMERMLYLGYLAGATFVHHESDAFATSIWVENYGRKGDYHISPFGVATRRWFDFTQRHPDRGTAYTPFALMIDGNHGWAPADDHVWRTFSKTRGERAVDEIANLFFPWGFSMGPERGYLPHGPFGDTVDVISHEAAQDNLAGYRVVFLMGDVPINDEVAARLRSYVESGGTVVADADQAERLGGEVARAWAAENVEYTAGARRPSDEVTLQTAVYPYRPLRRDAGDAWWSTGDGRPLVVEVRRGRGRIVVVAVPQMLDVRGRLLPLVRRLVARLYHGLLPVRVRGDIEFTLARNADGWVVGLINSNGILKRATEPVEVSPGAVAEVEITAPWRAEVAQEWTTDARLENLSADATQVHVTVPPGEVRVVLLGRPPDRR